MSWLQKGICFGLESAASVDVVTREVTLFPNNLVAVNVQNFGGMEQFCHDGADDSPRLVVIVSITQAGNGDVRTLTVGVDFRRG